MNIMSIEESSDQYGFAPPRKFYIDCPMDAEMENPKLTRIEIPRALAIYVSKLQDENIRLKAKLNE